MVLGHAAGKPQDDTRLPGFMLHQITQPPDDALFRVLPNRAGIQQNDIGTLRRRRGFVALRFQQAQDEFGVRDIHLTAVGFNIDGAWFHMRCPGPLTPASSAGQALALSPKGRGDNKCGGNPPVVAQPVIVGAIHEFVLLLAGVKNLNLARSKIPASFFYHMRVAVVELPAETQEGLHFGLFKIEVFNGANRVRLAGGVD